jgi:hypothetical protein
MPPEDGNQFAQQEIRRQQTHWQPDLWRVPCPHAWLAEASAWRLIEGAHDWRTAEASFGQMIRRLGRTGGIEIMGNGLFV